MSDSVLCQRRQPTRLPHPWDSPGKNTGVGCHFLLQCMKVKSESKVSVVSNSSQPPGLQPTRLLCPLDFPGKSTGVGCHCLLRPAWLLHLKLESPLLSPPCFVNSTGPLIFACLIHRLTHRVCPPQVSRHS